ncbi:MAG: ferrochelatase [Planctomycetaceae bacterium]
MSDSYDAILFVSFGGPEGPDDVIPFLENVLRGRNVPRERMLEVAEHYQHFGGVSPINQQTRDLIEAVTHALRKRGIDLPIYWGNRNWHPLLPATLSKMADEGRQRAIAFVVSAYSSYSGCRQYREDVERAREVVGSGAPQVEKIRTFYNHPDFIAVNAENLRKGLDSLPEDRRGTAKVAFTAHSIPSSMAATCNYELQLREACRLTAEASGLTPERWDLVYQSRSGRPEDPWLEPDILDHLRTQHAAGVADVVILPIGFLSDHMEVLYDLDEEAQLLGDELGVNVVRAATVGTHPQFIDMVCKLIAERVEGAAVCREAIGQYGPNWDVCPVDCCPAPRRPARPAT